MSTELDRVLAFASAPSSDESEAYDKGDTGMLVSAADAAVDEACRLFRSEDISSLPSGVQQAIALVWAAQTVIDGLMDKLDIHDPDDEMSEYAKMTGSYTDAEWSHHSRLLMLAGKVSGGDANKPYGDVKYADPGLQSDGKKRYPIDTEAHVRAAWAYINMPKNQKGYTSGQLARVKSAIQAAGRKLGITYSDGD